MSVADNMHKNQQLISSLHTTPGSSTEWTWSHDELINQHTYYRTGYSTGIGDEGDAIAEYGSIPFEEAASSTVHAKISAAGDSALDTCDRANEPIQQFILTTLAIDFIWQHSDDSRVVMVQWTRGRGPYRRRMMCNLSWAKCKRTFDDANDGRGAGRGTTIQIDLYIGIVYMYIPPPPFSHANFP